MRYFATRSLTDPVGFAISSLANMRTPGIGRHPRDLDQRRVADRVDDVGVCAPDTAADAGSAGHHVSPRHPPSRAG